MQAYETASNLELEPKAFSKQSHQFWTLQLSGWLGYALVVFVAIIRPQFDDPNFNMSGQLINLAIEVLAGFGLSYLQWLIIQKIVHLPLRTTLLISFSSAFILGLILNIIKLAAYKTIVYDQVWYEELNMLEFGGWFLFSLSTMFIWTALFFIMLYNTKLQKEHEMLLRAQTSAKESQLQMLRYQLNPHFMFNTMNAISTLIYKKDNEKAGEMVDKLCTFFRYSLDEKNARVSTLRKEVELLEVYFSIEQVRFADKLTVAMNIAPQALDARVPTLFLQPIVENAIKHGIEARKQHGQIEISATLVSDNVLIVVKNDNAVETKKAGEGFGIGLTNTIERLETMFNKHCQLTLNNQGDQTEVRIMFPYIVEGQYVR
ncbi:sensor histidine kinase [Thalassotalea ganghwensis]